MSESHPRRVSASALTIALALGTVYLVWGSTYLAIRVAIESIPPFTMAAVRFLTAGALLYAWARWRGEGRPSLLEWRSSLILGGLLLLGGNGGVVWAEQRVDSGLAALLISTEPLWIVLLAWLAMGHRRPRWRAAAGLLLGFAGVALLLRPATGAVTYLPGAVVVVLASCSWATGSLYALRAPQPRSPLLATAMQMLAGGGLLGLAGMLSGEPARLDLERVSAASLGALLYLVVFGAVAFCTYVWLLRAAPPVLVSTYAYVNPVVAVCLGWAILHEPLSRGMLVAAAVILAGVALIASAPGAAPGAAAARREEPALEPAALLEEQGCVSAAP